jgi:hypothetical protein
MKLAKTFYIHDVIVLIVRNHMAIEFSEGRPLQGDGNAIETLAHPTVLDAQTRFSPFRKSKDNFA